MEKDYEKWLDGETLIHFLNVTDAIWYTYHISISDMQMKDRQKVICYARYSVIKYLLDKMKVVSNKNLSHAMHKHHSTISWYIAHVPDFYKYDLEFKRFYDRLVRNLTTKKKKKA